MIREEIAKASLAKEKQDSSALNKLFKEFKENDFIFLEGNKKNLPTKIVVSDPDCPYCREHLSKIEKELETSNIKLIFAPVHDKNAFIKSQLAMQEISKLPQHDTPAKLKVLRKYYQNIKLNTQEMKTDYSQITKNKEKIFASGIIRGVPFIFEEQQ
ncbi:MAG: hypothetical protein K2I63_04820 [Helicobacter sp.]|nr:hypothetical protein [Helicobacter sp.]